MDFPGLPERYIGREQILPRGHRGVVYRAEDAVLERIVAVKAIRLPDSAGQQSLPPMLRQLAQLNHPGIIDLFDIEIISGTDGAYLCLIMPFIGRNLAEKSGQIWGMQTAVTLVTRLAEALAYAHQHGIVHGNIKPSNILLRGETLTDPQPVLVDFSLAHIWPTAPEDLEAAGNSLAYMALERLAGKAPEASGDVYSLGVILYELLAGQRPFSITTTRDAWRLQTTTPAPLTGVPPALEAILHQMLAQKSKDRPTATEVAINLPASLRSADQAETGIEPDNQPDPAPETGVDVQGAYLVIPKRPSGEIIDLKGKHLIIIGSAAEADLVLTGAAVLEKHARLRRVPQGWEIESLAEREENAILLDGRPLLVNTPRLLMFDQTIQVGGWELRFQQTHERTADASLRAVPQTLRVTPGQTGTLTIALNNTGLEKTLFRLWLEDATREDRAAGMPVKGWCPLSEFTFYLEPKESKEVAVRFDVPITAVAGPYDVKICAEDLFQPEKLPQEHTAALVIDELVEIDVRLDTAELEHKKLGLLTIRNTGNREMICRLTIRSEVDENLKFGLGGIASASSGNPTDPAASTRPARRPLRRITRLPGLSRFAPTVEQNPVSRATRSAQWYAGGASAALPSATGSGEPLTAPENKRLTPDRFFDQGEFFQPADSDLLREDREWFRLPANSIRQHSLALKYRPLAALHSRQIPYTMVLEVKGGGQREVSGLYRVVPRVSGRMITAVMMVLLLACILLTLASAAFSYGDSRLIQATEQAWAYGDGDFDQIPNYLEIRNGTDPCLKNSPNEVERVDANLRKTAVPRPDLCPTTPTPIGTPSPQPTPTAISNTITLPTADVFASWVITSGAEFAGYVVSGQPPNSHEPYLRVGDDRENRQIKSFLSFDASSIGPGTRINNVQLTLWITDHIGLEMPLLIYVDVGPAGGFSGQPDLETADFDAPAPITGLLLRMSDSPDIPATLNLNDHLPEIRTILQTSSVIEFRLYTILPTDGDNEDDQYLFFSGRSAGPDKNDEQNDAKMSRPPLLTIN